MIASSEGCVEDMLRQIDDGASLKDHEDFQESCMTGPTDTGSISEDESLGWFGGIAADIKTLAGTLKETAGGVASFVQRSALAVASEIAHLEEEEMAQHQAACHLDSLKDKTRLPWEIQCTNGSFEEDENLKLKILALSTKEETFLRPYSSKDDSSISGSDRPPFLLDGARIHLVRELLDMDDKLAAMHARLSGRSDVKETVFWQNYFHNCELTREEYFVFNPLAEQADFADENEDDDEGSFIEVPTPPASQRSVGSIVIIASATNLDLSN